MSLRAIWDCMFTPRLIKIYGNGPVEKLYEPNTFEKWGDQVITSLYIMWKISIYTSPFLTTYFYRKGYFVADGLYTLTKFVTSLGVILVVSFCIRGIGRANSNTYQRFIKCLRNAHNNLTYDSKQEMAVYDFDFYGWPVEFRWSDSPSGADRHRMYITRPALHRNAFQLTILAQGLLQGRSKLIEINRGMRYKLHSQDDNDIDTMFIDKRHATLNGNTLVICCEGNAGFYEVGIMGTPIEAGYSVLGWNHPGFGGSTGTPYPSQEQSAVDVVMQFAIHKLGFKIENIILFGWSIGGYSSTWAAMNYPDVKGIILDASFDDILPLALNHMPKWAESIVRLAIREYVNLNNFEQLSKYPGPVLLVRRTEDEVLCTTENDLSSNRGNNLLVKLLKYRYPLILGESQIQLLSEYLATTATKQEQFVQKYNVDSDLCKSLIESHVSEHSKSYPMRIGEEMEDEQKNHMTLFLAAKYMKDFKSTHCTPLPTDMFQQPWDVNVDTDYVFT